MSHLQNCCLKIYLKRTLGGGVGLGGQDGCERRIKVFVKIQKNEEKNLVGVGLGGGGGQGGCERRIEGVRWWVGLVRGSGWM